MRIAIGESGNWHWYRPGRGREGAGDDTPPSASAWECPWYREEKVNETTIIASIIGTGIGVTAVVVSVIAIVASGINSRLNTMNARIEALRSDMRDDHHRLDTRLRSVEIEFGKVGQRLETLERAVLPQAPPA